MLTAEVEVCYDPKTHITAGELRKLGFLIPEVVSDVAFVRRVAVGVNDDESLDRKSCTVKLDVLEQFVEPQEHLELTSIGFRL